MINRAVETVNIKNKFDYNNQSDISIIATNCIGGELYHILRLKFNSPFINISMKRSEFARMAELLPEYMDCDIRVQKDDGGYVGVLGNEQLEDVTVRFPHDNDPENIRQNWDKRKRRINFDKIVLICDDKGMKLEEYERLDRAIAYKKICFITEREPKQYNWAKVLEPYKDLDQTGTYNGKSLNGLWKFQRMWDYISFLNL